MFRLNHDDALLLLSMGVALQKEDVLMPRAVCRECHALYRSCPVEVAAVLPESDEFCKHFKGNHKATPRPPEELRQDRERASELMSSLRHLVEAYPRFKPAVARFMEALSEPE